MHSIFFGVYINFLQFKVVEKDINLNLLRLFIILIFLCSCGKEENCSSEPYYGRIVSEDIPGLNHRFTLFDEGVFTLTAYNLPACILVSDTTQRPFWSIFVVQGSSPIEPQKDLNAKNFLFELHKNYICKIGSDNLDSKESYSAIRGRLDFNGINNVRFDIDVSKYGLRDTILRDTILGDTIFRNTFFPEEYKVKGCWKYSFDDSCNDCEL